jgi:hypothetical protein
VFSYLLPFVIGLATKTWCTRVSPEVKLSFVLKPIKDTAGVNAYDLLYCTVSRYIKKIGTAPNTSDIVNIALYENSTSVYFFVCGIFSTSNTVFMWRPQDRYQSLYHIKPKRCFFLY